MENRNNGKMAFMVLCLIGFATFVSSYLRIPVMPLFAAKLGAVPAQIGLINGAFMLTAGVLSIPAGIMVDRLGNKPLVVAGIAATALSSLLITACRHPGEMMAAYLFFGAGLAAFAPGMLSLVAETMPAERLGQAYGLYSTAIYIAMTIGPATGGYLAKQLGLREVFLVSAAALACVALIALLTLPKSAPRKKTEIHAAMGGTLSLLRYPYLRACLLATTGSCIGFGLFLTFLPLYAASFGYDPSKVGLLFAAQAITNVVGRVPIGMVADKIDRRKLVAAGLCFLATAMVILGQVSRLELLMLGAVVMGVGMALSFTSIGALIAEKTPPAQRGLAMGMYNSCVYLGMMLGSAGMGVALHWVSYASGFMLAGLLAVATMVAFMLLDNDQHPKPAHD